MRRCLQLAAEAAERDEVPVGALLVRDGEVLAEASNAPIGNCDPTAHAEILALRRAAHRCGNYRLPFTTLYCTIEPCLMCAGALLQARVGCVVYGAPEPRSGAINSLDEISRQVRSIHRFEVVAGVLQEECAALLKAFFKQRR